MTKSQFRSASAATVVFASLLLASGAEAKSHPKSKHRSAAHTVSHSMPARSYGNSTLQPKTTIDLAIGRGQLVNLSEPISDVFTSNPGAVDINVRSTQQIYLFAKDRGTASVYATNKAGRIIYSSDVHVELNIDSLDQMLRTTMPDAQITATRISGMIILSGTVINPEDATQAGDLVSGYVGNDPASKLKKVLVVNRIKTATPQQVNLQVRIAEVSRSVSKQIGVNLLNHDTAGSGGAIFGVASGRSNAVGIANKDLSLYPTRDFSTQYGYPAGTLARQPYDPSNPGIPLNQANPGKSYTFTNLAGQTVLGLAGKFLGMDVGAALDLAETDGDVTTLAQPNLTALSGETASFLAGGEVPIPIAGNSQGGYTSVTVEYKPYGVSLSFTPIVLADGHISLHVRPEVSELTSDGAVTVGGLVIPAFKTRRSETTVELGSGQSMVISGLMSNSNSNSTTKAPGLGDVPILGAMFRSNTYQKGESELMIVVTPYLVKPVNANQIVLPTDGVKAPTDLQRVLLGKNSGGKNGSDRPKPTSGAPTTKAHPAVGAVDVAPGGSQAETQAPVQAALVSPVDQPRFEVATQTPANNTPVPLQAPPAVSAAPGQPTKVKAHAATVDAAPGFGS